MPKKLERQLKKEAMKKFPGDKKAQNSYVYGTMNKMNMLKDKKESDNKDES